MGVRKQVLRYLVHQINGETQLPPVIRAQIGHGAVGMLTHAFPLSYGVVIDAHTTPDTPETRFNLAISASRSAIRSLLPARYFSTR